MMSDASSDVLRQPAIVILAPHLTTPIRNGADVYIWNKWRAVDPTRWHVTLVAGDGDYLLDADGRWQLRRATMPTGRSRRAAAVLMLRDGLDYLSAKFNTPAYLRFASTSGVREALLVVCSFPSTWRMAVELGLPADRLVLESHNFDPKLYLDRAGEMRGIRKGFAALAAARSMALLRAMPRSLPVIALGSSDRLFYEAMGFGEVMEGRLGFDARPLRTRFAQGPVPRLIFVGSLSVSMNEAAVRGFVEQSLPALRAQLQGGVDFTVAGSRPSRALEAFLARHDVTLHANPSDLALSELVETSHATVMPFTSTNGLKLKFGLAASHGVPMLSFIAPPEGLQDVRGVLVSRDMAHWASFLEELAGTPGSQQACAEALFAAVRRCSWAAIVAHELPRLTNAMGVRA